MKCSCLLLLAMSAVPSGMTAAEWIRIGSPNFELYTTGSEDDARGTLENFEQAREFFLKSKLFVVPPSMPVVLVAFGTEREYKPYAFKSFAPAYYLTDQQRDYVVMSDLGDKRGRVAIHEYVHVLVRHSGLDLPLWLNEGLADVYSAMKSRGDGQVLLGNIPDDRAESLGSGNWIRLERVLNATPESAEYNDGPQSGMFYAQSCLLVHMLMLGEGYVAKFPEFLATITGASSSQKVLGEVYGKSPGELEKEMLAYFRQQHIGAATYAAAPAKVTIEPTRPATDAEVELHLARLVGMLGRRDEARDRLTRLAASHPENHQIDEAQAYVALLSGDRAAALQKLGQVISGGGATSWKTYWDYAALLHLSGHADRTELIDALREALQRKPELAAGRLMLARELYAVGRRSQALSELRLIRDVDPREAASMYLLMAQSAIELGQPDEARRYVELGRKYVKRPEDLVRLESLVRRLDAASAKPRSGSADEDDDRRPVLRRRDPPKAPARKAKIPAC